MFYTARSVYPPCIPPSPRGHATYRLYNNYFQKSDLMTSQYLLTQILNSMARNAYFHNKKVRVFSKENSDLFGASEGTRTPMHKAQDPKSCASTNSATLA